MTTIGQPERASENRIIALFRDELHYRYLGKLVKWIPENKPNAHVVIV